MSTIPTLSTSGVNFKARQDYSLDEGISMHFVKLVTIRFAYIEELVFFAEFWDWQPWSSSCWWRIPVVFHICNAIANTLG